MTAGPPTRLPRTAARSTGLLVAALAVLPLLASCSRVTVDAQAEPTTTALTDSISAATSTTPTATTSSSTTTTSTTTSTTTITTTTEPGPTLPPQPLAPIGAPADPRGPEPHVELGRLEIPRIDVDTMLLQGIRLTTLDQGPGHWPGTALPGHRGNMVIGGHRTTHDQVFRHLEQLEAGDEIVVTTVEGRFVYQVTEVLVLEPTDVWIVEPTPFGRATLFACHPPGSTRQRIAAFADLVTE